MGALCHCGHGEEFHRDGICAFCNCEDLNTQTHPLAETSRQSIDAGQVIPKLEVSQKKTGLYQYHRAVYKGDRPRYHYINRDDAEEEATRYRQQLEAEDENVRMRIEECGTSFLLRVFDADCHLDYLKYMVLNPMITENRKRPMVWDSDPKAEVSLVFAWAFPPW